MCGQFENKVAKSCSVFCYQLWHSFSGSILYILVEKELRDKNYVLTLKLRKVDGKHVQGNKLQ
jgi:hypothetical protein